MVLALVYAGFLLVMARGNQEEISKEDLVKVEICGANGLGIKK